MFQRDLTYLSLKVEAVCFSEMFVYLQIQSESELRGPLSTGSRSVWMLQVSRG